MHRRHFSWILGLASLLAVALLTPPAGVASAGASAGTSSHSTSNRSPLTVQCPIGPNAVPRCGAWWGEAVPNSGSDLVAAVNQSELQTGRPLDIVHTYHRWSQPFPTPEETALAHTGHLLLINWQPTDPDGRPIPWAAVADGSQDPVISAEAERLATFHLPVMVSFAHEPEADLGKEGTAASFVSAFRRVHDEVTADGATNVIWVWDMEGIPTTHWLALYRTLWPGAAYVDWIAWDP